MRLFFLFLYTFFLSFFIAFLFPGHHLSYYAPFLIICCYRTSFPITLWLALICGICFDLFCSDTRLGAHALTYCLTISYLCRFKFYFFKDHLTTLPLMTYLFVCFSNLTTAILFYGSGKEFFVSWNWFISDFLSIPLTNAIYAFSFFTLPFQIFFNKRRWIWKSLFRKRAI